MDLIDYRIVETVEDNILRTKTSSSKHWIWNLMGLFIIIIMLLALYLTREPEPESTKEKTIRMIDDTLIPKPTFSTFIF